MRKTLATLAILAASVCSAYTNTVLVSTNTRAATEKWVSVRFEATLPSTPTNPASKYLNGNREWSSISLGHPQLSDINGDANYQHITTGQVSKLDYISDSGVLRVNDSAQPSRYFLEVVNSTGTVFEVTGPFTNLMVTLSDDFQETITQTHPLWTTNAFPFVDGWWKGTLSGNIFMIEVQTEVGTARWYEDGVSFPSVLIPVTGQAQGTATVSVAEIYYYTNAIKHLATETELEAAKAACGVVLTNTVNAATNALMPYARTVYGDLATTNEAGYAAFNATSAAASSYSAIVPTSFIGSNTNTLRYRFNSLRKFGVLTNRAWFVKSGFGAGIKSVSTLVSVKDSSGNVISQSSSQPVYLSDSSSPSALTNIFTMPDNVYSGTVDVACIAVSTNASFSVRLYSGAQYTNLLTFSEAPTAYATYAELRSLRVEIPAIVMSNSAPQTIVRSVRTSETNIVVSATNAVYYVALDNAANIGFDFSALSLGGTKRADITAIIDCLNTQALYSVINTNAVAMDCPWEPTVTGRYELAVSSDGVRTNVRQASPSSCTWRRTPWASYVNATGIPLNGPYPSQINYSSNEDGGIFCVSDTGELRFMRAWLYQNSVATGITVQVDSYYKWQPSEKNTSNVFLPNNVLIKRTYAMRASIDYSSPPYGWDIGAVLYVTCHNTIVRGWAPEMRDANALERAAYNAGAYPAAFRLDY